MSLTFLGKLLWVDKDKRRELRLCREGVIDCERCVRMKSEGLNPYTGEPL